MLLKAIERSERCKGGKRQQRRTYRTQEQLRRRPGCRRTAFRSLLTSRRKGSNRKLISADTESQKKQKKRKMAHLA